MPTKKSKISITSPPLPLPLELISLILTHLYEVDRASLATACQVSKAMFQVAAPILYRQIHVSPLIWRDSRNDHSPDRFTPTGKEKTNTRKKKILKNAEIVIIDSHHATWCGNKSFKYPNLKTLVLNLTVNGFGPVLHGNDILEKQCSLVKCLQPKKLVLFGMTLTSITTYEMFGVPPKIFENIEQLTLVAPMEPIKPRSIWGGFSDMPKLKKLVWIFHTAHPALKWSSGSQALLGEGGAPKKTDLNALGHFLREVSDIPTYVVNSGSLHPNYVGKVAGSKVEIKGNVVDYLENLMSEGEIGPWFSSGWKEGISDTEKQEKKEKFRKRFDNIRFISMKEYLENHDWTGEILPDEAKLWIA
uniref:F-box domain-containing protein n=1 Tax=Kwoniella pini CBS 10737 TaxID=1296096 RepID=A0A1B9HVI2_9TREE|nr:uncharacterized protein I206_07062 [Kwoniella pini CBS 10737]OCF47284.1 hypothetical protein I206_07062 [Kwoniella pini CBS 10737]